MNDDTIRFTLQPCRDKGGTSAKPEKPVTLDLKKVAEAYEIVIDTPHVIVVKTECGEAIVHRHGEIIFKTCRDEQTMKKIAAHIYSEAIAPLK